MNNGKICVSVCAETADELIQQIKRAEDLADVIEIRFDCLNEDEFDRALQKLQKLECPKPFLATFRPKEQGGKRPLILRDRIKFWESFLQHNKDKNLYIDFEPDLRLNLDFKIKNKIVSLHDFSGFPNDLTPFLDLFKSNPAIIKIAVQANDITDTIPIWKLLERAKRENQEIIPIAMGESGKWTRILGPAHGAFMTYASLDSGQETAPGQVSARDLREVYRAGELDETTDIYGILGGNTSYSMSPLIHNAAFKSHRLNSVFVPLQVQDLDEFVRRMVKPETREIELNFKGFAVTIPHKQAIIKHLDDLDESARKIGAVNTVKIAGGRLCGYNTDAEGFIAPLLNSYGDLRGARVGVFGAGGAARACLYALKNEGAQVTVFARNLAKARILADEFEFQIEHLRAQSENYNDFDILVNTTPLGTKGELENQSVVSAAQIESVRLVYDLVYNPLQTKLMIEAERAGIPKMGGLAMLIAQAAAQQKIWTGLGAPVKEMSRPAWERLR